MSSLTWAMWENKSCTGTQYGYHATKFGLMTNKNKKNTICGCK